MIQGECLGQQILLTIRVRTETNSLDSTDRPLSYWPTAGIVKLEVKNWIQRQFGVKQSPRNTSLGSLGRTHVLFVVRLSEVKSLQKKSVYSR